jgi:putative chitinase
MEGVEYVAANYPYRSAQTWIKQNNLLAIARTQGFPTVCRRINGGWNGYEDRLQKYAKCRQFINF